MDNLLDILKSEDSMDISIIKESLYYDVDQMINLLKQKQQSFTIFSLNCQSLNAKFDQLQILMKRLESENIHLSAICLQETWISQNSNDALFNLTGYNFIYQPAICSSHSGTAIYLHENYEHVMLPLYNGNTIWEGQFMKITNLKHLKNIIIGNIYRPPTDLLQSRNIFVEDFNNILIQLEKYNCEVIICGDFNIDLLKVNVKKSNADYLDLILSTGFFPKITLPTRITNQSSTLIDNILCRITTRLIDSPAGILNTHISDHLPIFICIKNVFCKDTVPKYVKTWDNSLNAKNSFKQALSSADIFSQLENNLTMDPNVNYNKLENILTSIKDKTMPCKLVKFHKYKHKKNDWITPGIIKSIKFKDGLYKKLKNIKEPCIERTNASINLKTYEKLLKKTIKMAKRKYYCDLFSRYKGNIKETWATLSKLIGKTQKKREFSEYFIHNDKSISDNTIIANEFNKYFAEVGSNTARSIKYEGKKHYSNFLKNEIRSQMIFQLIDTVAVENIINELKPKESTGYDNISAKLLKYVKNEVSPALTLIINQSFSTGIFPNKLKIARVLPLFKKEDEKLLSNYRPISLLPVISKIFERAMFVQLYTYFKDNNLFCKNQYGFLQGLSTELAAMELTDRIVKDMDMGKIPLNIYIDLSKAFDTLDHSILIRKLHFYGINGTTLNLFESYLSNRKQYVDWDGQKSDLLNITTGVPQGSILGPLMFIIYINDIVHATQSFDLIMYADDTTMYISIDNTSLTNEELTIMLNTELNKVTDWFKVNKLALNDKKTKYMLFALPRKKVPKLELRIDGKQIDKVNQFNFLGLELDNNMNWSNHINKIAAKISKSTGIMNKLKHILPQNILLTLYNTLILPHLNYCLLTWGSQTVRIFKLQKKALRIICLSKYNAHTEPIFKMLHILKLDDLYKYRMLKFYFKLVKSSSPFYFVNVLDSQPRQTLQNTRFQNNLRLPLVKISHDYGKRGIHYNLAKIVNEASTNVMSKVFTHSLNGYSQYIKQVMVDKYSQTCQNVNCYICNNVV